MNTAALMYLVTGVVSSLIIIGSAIASRRRRYIEVISPAVQDVVSAVRNILSERLEGLASGYGCQEEGFRIDFPSSRIAIRGFDGEWSCCVLGCGGWGCAYLCRDGGREAVFKVPRGFEGIFRRDIPTINRELIEKVLNEAEALKNLDHPNVVKLLAASSVVPLLIYEYANNGSLQWQISKGFKPGLREVLVIGIQLADALRYIHSRGLIHGDIKPGNIFIKDGVAKLGDFSSIVKLLTYTSSLSKLQYTVGFRAPEQVYSDLGKKARELGIENRIDVYQLGNIILFLLTGESIDGEDANNEKLVEEKLAKVKHRELQNILREMLSYDPSKRPSSEDVVKRLYGIWVKEFGYDRPTQ